MKRQSRNDCMQQRVRIVQRLAVFTILMKLCKVWKKEEKLFQKKKTWSGKVEAIATKSQGCAKFTSLHNPNKIVQSLAKEGFLGMDKVERVRFVQTLAGD